MGKPEWERAGAISGGKRQNCVALSGYTGRDVHGLSADARHANVGKREVKAPKVYVADSGLLHSLLGIGDEDSLLAHPKCGASWEGLFFARLFGALMQSAVRYFSGACMQERELDLLILQDGRRQGLKLN